MFQGLPGDEGRGDLDGALRIEAAPDGRVEDLEGGLVDEILRRQDRLPGR